MEKCDKHSPRDKIAEMIKQKEKRQEEKHSYLGVATELANLLSEKNAAYGNSFEESGRILEILYPNGISVSKYSSALILVRILDKLFRIANNEKAFNEDPWQDIAGYALLSVISQRKRKENPCVPEKDF